MSSFSTPIVRIENWEKNPNADNLAVTHIFDYPVQFRIGEFNTGDLAIFCPEESVMPDRAEYQWIWNNKPNPLESQRKIKAKRLRGIYSEGILIKVPENLKHLPVGTDVSKELGIEKFEKPEEVILSGDNENRPGWFPVYTDIENIRKYRHVLNDGENVVLTTKIHGCNSAFSFNEDRLWVSSHRNIKKLDCDNIWTKIASQYDMQNRLKQIPGHVLYGEVYGSVQKGFHYDAKGTNKFRAFDIWDCEKRKYLDYQDFVKACQDIEIDMAPILYMGGWKGIEGHFNVLEGLEPLSNSKHVREGYVITPIQEKWHKDVGRVKLKFINPDYLLKKE